MPRRDRSALVGRVLLVMAVAAIGLSIGLAIPNFTSMRATSIWVVLTFMVTIAAGEIWRVHVSDSRDLPPLALAASFAFAMVTETPESTGHDDLAGVVVIGTGIASAAGVLLREYITGERLNRNVVLVRILSVAFAVLIFRVLMFGGRTLQEWTSGWDDQRWLVALTLWVVAALAMAVHMAVTSLERAITSHARIWPNVVDEAVSMGPVGIGVTSSAAVIPLAITALGPIAIPLFLLPLVLLRLAMVRQASVRTAQRQTIYALSRLTEQGGFTPTGHATRVARLSVGIGRHLGLSERDLVDLEYAALLHDLGQVSLRRAIPGGATVQTSPLDQRRIAAAGASILARTAELSRLAPVVADQATAQHRALETGMIHLPSRILRVANAFDDLAGLAGVDEPVVRALERIRLGTPVEYDPDVVRALCHVLVRDGRLAADSLNRYVP